MQTINWKQKNVFGNDPLMLVCKQIDPILLNFFLDLPSGKIDFQTKAGQVFLQSKITKILKTNYY